MSNWCILVWSLLSLSSCGRNHVQEMAKENFQASLSVEQRNGQHTQIFNLQCYRNLPYGNLETICPKIASPSNLLPLHMLSSHQNPPYFLPIAFNTHLLDVFQQETESERRSFSSTSQSQPGSHSVISLMESSVKRGRAIFEKMSSENGHSNSSEG